MQAISKTELQESNEQFISAWGRFAKGFPEAEISARGRLVIGWPDVPLLFYNNIFVTGEMSSSEELAATVDEAIEHSKTKRCAGMITVCHDLLSGSTKDEVEKIFSDRGYVAVMPSTGMAGDIFPLDAPVHPDLRIVKAEDGVVFTDLNCDAYHVPREVGELSVIEDSFCKDAYVYVGYLGDRPVATATTLVNGDTLYLAFVASAEDVRNKGYGSAVVRYSLQKAYEATGLVRTALHATEAGYPIYKRLGYEPVAKFTSYAAVHE